jgi:hypothetical protein
MRTYLAAMMIALLTASAYAQGMSGKRHHGGEQKAERSRIKGDEKSAKSPLDKLPDQKFDPWQTLRAPEPDKGEKKPN